MQFVAIDVETANADLSSICQVGVAIFQNGSCVDSWSSLVDPEDDFDGFNVSIHGIDEQKVKGAPTWPKVARVLSASQWVEVIDFASNQLGYWSAEYVFSPMTSPNVLAEEGAEEEAEGWQCAWEACAKSLAEQKPELLENLEESKSPFSL
jgi:DNA polymerase-3 subunit epsilon